MTKVTMADVAQKANVSKSTVSQYINERYEYMGEETKKRIELAIKELGYHPNIVARSLKQKTTSTIGVIVANILHEFSTQVIRSIEDTCHLHDFHIIVCNADDDPKKEKKYIEMLQAKQVDGLIIFPTGENLQLYEQMLKENYPVVFIDRYVEGVKIPSIMLDNKKASRLAVHHLVESGYERLGIVTTSIKRNVIPRVERLEGFKQALIDFGIAINDDYIKTLEVNEIKNELKKMLSLKHPPQALLAGNDLALVEIIKFIKANDLSIPEDIAVVGIDEVSFANFYTPPLTTIAQPTFEMGKKAATILINKIRSSEDPDTNYESRFEPSLIVRESTKKE